MIKVQLKPSFLEGLSDVKLSDLAKLCDGDRRRLARILAGDGAPGVKFLAGAVLFGYAERFADVAVVA